MDTQKLIDLFSKALIADCNVIKSDNAYSIEIMEPDSTLDENAYLNFLSNYGIKAEILSKNAPLIIGCQISSSDEFERQLESLNSVIELHELAKMGNINALEKILKQGMDVDTVNIKGETPLMLAVYAAAYMGSLTVEFLLKKGANINHRDQGGATALHIAVYGAEDPDNDDALSTTKFLLDNGADATIATCKGMTALKLADQLKNKEIGKILIDALLKKDLKVEKPHFDMQDLSDYWDDLVQNSNAKSMTQEEAGARQVRAAGSVNSAQFFSRSANDVIVDEMEKPLTAINLGK